MEVQRLVLPRDEEDPDVGRLVERIYSGERVMVECGDRAWSCSGVVFAPNGTEPGIDVDGSAPLHGFGVSYSAADDAPFYRSRRVAVYGDAPRVIEHAWIAARYASDIVVLLKGAFAETQVELLRELQHVVPATGVVHGEAPGQGIVFAGLAAGVAYWDHPELVTDGARAARTLLAGGA
jgi:thioredoxin reductase